MDAIIGKPNLKKSTVLEGIFGIVYWLSKLTIPRLQAAINFSYSLFGT